MSKPQWRKASFSQPNDDCVELALLEDGSVRVRDSKAGDEGPVLKFTRSEMAAFSLVRKPVSLTTSYRQHQYIGVARRQVRITLPLAESLDGAILQPR